METIAKKCVNYKRRDYDYVRRNVREQRIHGTSNSN